MLPTIKDQAGEKEEEEGEEEEEVEEEEKEEDENLASIPNACARYVVVVVHSNLPLDLLIPLVLYDQIKLVELLRLSAGRLKNGLLKIGSKIQSKSAACSQLSW